MRESTKYNEIRSGIYKNSEALTFTKSDELSYKLPAQSKMQLNWSINEHG